MLFIIYACFSFMHDVSQSVWTYNNSPCGGASLAWLGSRPAQLGPGWGGPQQPDRVAHLSAALYQSDGFRPQALLAGQPQCPGRERPPRQQLVEACQVRRPKLLDVKLQEAFCVDFDALQVEQDQIKSFML